MKNAIAMSAIGLVAALGSGAAFAAAPADWSKVPAVEVTLLYPGVSPVEWITKGTEHGGARVLRRGETCIGCHSEEADSMGTLIASGKKIEPNPIPGKAPFIKAKVQAAHDGEHLYLRFSWTQPAASGAAKMDAKNAVKLAYMLEDGDKVELAGQGGCWGSCHAGVRTMPGGADDKTKYVKDGSLDAGVFYDLNQWRSGENAVFDGYIADKRVMEGGQALVKAVGAQKDGVWTVEFTRRLSGGKGDVTLAPGKAYNFGFAIHDDSSVGRYHHVSLGYKLGIDAEGDIVAKKL